MSSKKPLFLQMLQMLMICVNDILAKKTTFSKWSRNNLIFLEILIFLNIWAIFSKRSKEKSLFLKFWYLSFKKTFFSSKYWYFRSYEQKTIFKSDPKKTSFFSKGWYIWKHGQKGYFWKYRQKNDFFKVISKKHPFSRNVANVDTLAKKNDFFKVISK